MDIWFISFVGGLVGALLMDVTEAAMARAGIGSGITGAYVGRWVQGLRRGVIHHRDIRDTTAENHEARAGLIFHFVIGGGVVALFYPLSLQLLAVNETANHLLLATAFGLATCVLPWLVLMPSFGWGLFGSGAPAGARPIISPVLSHIPYGFGIGLTLAAYYALKLQPG